MNTIQELFKKLTANPEDPSEIRNLLGQTEDLHLECKTVAEDEIEKNLLTNKQSVVYFNYGKCISAFANAEGGVIVWGLFAKEQKKAEPDLIQQERPIKRVTKVKTDFDAITGKVVSRRVVGVNNRIVFVDKDKDIGFIVTFVPMSDEAPHRVEAERKESGKYYRRHGSGSYAMEHYELEEMFGRRASPKLRLVLSMYGAGVVSGKPEDNRLKFGLKNIGRAIAQFPFLEVIRHNGLIRDPYGVDGNYQTGMPLIKGAVMKYQGGISDVIHIDDILWIDQFRIKADINHEIEMNVACDGFRMKKFHIIIPNINYFKDWAGQIFEYEPGENNKVQSPDAD